MYPIGVIELYKRRTEANDKSQSSRFVEDSLPLFKQALCDE